MAENRQRQSFDELMAQIANGSNEAVWELITRYHSNILRLVRRRLPDQIRSKVDSVDIVQSVWRSLLRNPPILRTPEAFFEYLVTMARNKVFETHRQYTNVRARDISKERPIGNFPSSAWIYSKDHPDGIASSKTNAPSAIVRARETLNLAIASGGDRTRQIIDLRLQGLTLAEIADKLEVSQSTVRRALQFVLESLSK